jgi:hypothetical protein
MTDEKGEIVAKVKFWFGGNEPIFDIEQFVIEHDDDRRYAYVYKKKDSTQQPRPAL